MERSTAPKYQPSAMDDMIIGVIGKIDGGFTLLSDLAFGSPKVETITKEKKKTEEEKKESEEEKKETKEEKKTEKPEKTDPLTKAEVEEYQLEALRSLVEGGKPNIPRERLDAIGSIEPTAGLAVAEESLGKEQAMPPRSAVSNDEASDLRELEIEINHYIGMIKKNKENQRKVARKNNVRLATLDDGHNLLAVLKEVERRHEQEQLDQFQYRRQNMVHNNEHQIWSYVGDYYTGGAKRQTNPARAAPSPENMLGRMVPRQESDDLKQARINKMLDALDRRMAKQDAARRQHDDGDFERTLQRREARKREMQEENFLLGLLVDLGLIDEDEFDAVDDAANQNPETTEEEHLSSTLDQLDKEFYEEIEEATKEDYGIEESKGEDTGIVTNDNEEDGMFGGGCLTCGAEAEEENVVTVNGVPATIADTTNLVNSEKVTYTPLNGDEVSDASTGDRALPVQEAQEDPPESSWFSFFGSASAKKAEAVIPEEIRLEDPPEAGEVREKEPKEPTEEVHVKKGLKIVAILEGSNEEVPVGTAKKPIMIQDDEVVEAPGLNGCWAGSQHPDLLTSE